jgi:translocation and assembly module TamB
VVIATSSSTAVNQDVNVYVDERSLFSIPIAADVSVALENDIRFTGFGISAQLGGDITYRQSATGASSTYGELSIISGSYTAYRQALVIRQGQLLFFGAIDNPALNIRAVRQVNDVTVGVLMNGTLKSINSQLFSTPALPENDIISLIATGRKFSTIGEGDGVNMLNTIANLGLNRSQGLTNSMRDKLGLDALQITNNGDINNSILTVGKYLTPDIFIRYGVGLFDNQSKISVDYTLSEHLKLQAESGEFQSIDITYTVEK